MYELRFLCSDRRSKMVLCRGGIDGAILTMAHPMDPDSSICDQMDQFEPAIRSEMMNQGTFFFENVVGDCQVRVSRKSCKSMPKHAISLGEAVKCKNCGQGAVSCAFAQLFVFPPPYPTAKRSSPLFTMKIGSRYGITTTGVPEVGTKKKQTKLSNAPPLGVLFLDDKEKAIFATYDIISFNVKSQTRCVMKAVPAKDGHERFRLGIVCPQESASITIRRGDCEYLIPFAVLKRPKTNPEKPPSKKRDRPSATTPPDSFAAPTPRKKKAPPATTRQGYAISVRSSWEATQMR
jgi:hypothetical protein